MSDESKIIDAKDVEEQNEENPTPDVQPTKKAVVAFLCCILLVLLGGVFVMGCQCGESRMQDSAIRHHAGEYYADETGNTHFRFIESVNASETEIIKIATEPVKVE